MKERICQTPECDRGPLGRHTRCQECHDEVKRTRSREWQRANRPSGETAKKYNEAAKIAKRKQVNANKATLIEVRTVKPSKYTARKFQECMSPDKFAEMVRRQLS